MLHLLKEYAEKHGLKSETGFKHQYIHWAIVFNKKGEFLHVIELGDTSSKRNPGLKFEMCPYIHFTSDGAGKSQFLYEIAKVVAYHGTDIDDKQICTKNQYLIELLNKAGQIMPELNLIASALKEPETLQAIREHLQENKARPTDKVTFKIGDDFPLRKTDTWHDWWRQHYIKYHKRKPKKIIRMRCFATGELITPARTHPMISGMHAVDGQARASLVSFNRPAFCSYGLEQSANAAVSNEAAATYSTALNELVEHYSSNLAGAMVIHWFEKNVPDEDDPLSFLSEGGNEELPAQRCAKELLESIQTGKRKDLLNNFYYALIVSGVESRIMVRDWMEGQFEELVTNIDRWFSDLAISNLHGSQNTKSPGIERVITCLLQPRKLRQKYADWIKPVGGERISLWRSAIRGDHIPYSVLGRLIPLHFGFFTGGSMKVVLDEKEEKNKKRALLRSLLYARMGLMKAYHIRQDKLKGKESEMKPNLNPDHPSPAYHCGRLLAVLAAVQRSALGDVGAGVVQRYYGAASTTPALILGRITATSQHHLAKIDSAGLAHWYEEKIAQIWSSIKDNLPATLSLEEQSLFALGYYQQLADLRTKKSKNDETNKESDNE